MRASRPRLPHQCRAVRLRTLTQSQTLADAAKKASESSSAAKGPSRSFSDKDLTRSLAEDGVIPTSDAGGDAVAPPGPVLSREELVNRVMPAVVTMEKEQMTSQWNQMIASIRSLARW